MRIATLAKAFDVTTETARRDLDDLAESGALKRTYGGGASRSLTDEPGIGVRSRTHAAERGLIARAAAAHGRAGRRADDRLRVDHARLRADAGGAGAAPHGRDELPARRPGARRESPLPHDPVLAAITSPREDGVYGADAVDFIRRFKANKAFIGAGGVTRDGVTDADSLGCSIKRAMMERSDRTILLVDSSKFDVVQFERVCALSDIDAMVSEAAPPSGSPPAWIAPVSASWLRQNDRISRHVHRIRFRPVPCPCPTTSSRRCAAALPPRAAATRRRPCARSCRQPASLRTSSRRRRRWPRRLAEGGARRALEAGGVDALMLEFSLDSREGIALMCLAEALLRIPDAATRDRLIRDKIGQGDWRAHVGAEPSLFVNAAAWGLLVTGKLVDTRSEGTLEQALASLLRKGGEPLIRKGVDLAMRLLGQQFVTGRTIDEALDNAREREARGYRFSFDMLGEAAMTDADADALSRRLRARDPRDRRALQPGAASYAGPGISIKLSALHPRYSRAQRERVHGRARPARAGARRARASATTSASTSTPRKPTGSSSRSTSSRRSRPIPRSPAGTASASSCRRTRSARAP